MPDVTLCATEGCPLGAGCHRRLAPHGRWQSVSDFNGGMRCEYFWPTDSESRSDSAFAELRVRLDALGPQHAEAAAELLSRIDAILAYTTTTDPAESAS
jgi:hypothetical protein